MRLSVSPRTRPDEVADRIRAGGVDGLEGNGWRSQRIALDACERAGGVWAHDPTGFSRQNHRHVATTDKTLSRSEKATQPWALAIGALIEESPTDWSWGVIEMGEGRLFLFA
jgi:hypothetical protein